MDDPLDLRKELLLVEQDLIRLHERLIPLLDRIIEAINELDSRIKTLEEDTIKKTIAFEAQKLGVSESEFLKNVADFINREFIRDKCDKK
ncbi:MAG: hypothetical protein QXL89_09870 [Nitrososphaeria archaeon]